MGCGVFVTFMMSQPDDYPIVGRRRTHMAVFLCLAVLTLIRLYYIQTIPLASDEAYTWQWSRHPAFGYYDHAPLIAWLDVLGTWLLGHTELGVRITAVALGLGLSLLVYDFCLRVLDDNVLGWWLALAINSSIGFTMASIIQTYDTAQCFLWLLCLEMTALALFKDQPRAWYGAGAAAGLGMLTKYTFVLLPGLIFLYLLTGSRRRYWLGRREPWLAAIIAGLIYSPNLVWNARHHWSAYAHTLGLGGGDGEWTFTVHEFLAGQVGMVGPVLFVMVILGLIPAWKQARAGDDLQAFLLWTSLPVLLFFLLVSAKTRAHGNWTAPGYLGAIIAAGWSLRPEFTGSVRWRRWGAAALVSGYVLVAAALCHTPLFNLIKTPAETDPTAEIYGWPEMGREVGRVLDQWPGAEKPFVFGLRYQTTSLAAFYLPGQPQTECLFLPGYRLNTYVFWSDPRDFKGRDGLGVMDRRYTRGTGGIELLFESVNLIKVLELKNPAGRVINRIALYHGRHFKGRDDRTSFYGWPHPYPGSNPVD